MKLSLTRVLENPSEPLDSDVQPAPWAVRQPAPGPRTRWVAIMLVLSGCLPLVFWHFVGLLQRPHYQFVVLLPVAAALLILRHRQKVSGEIRPLAPLPLAMLLAAVVGLAAATYYWSPWLGMVSALLAMYTCLWWAGGQSGLQSWLPAWVIGWLAVPLPFGMDEDLILWLRTSTTRMASAVLDHFGILHLSYANVIELPLKPLFIADACSGIHSLYVLLAVALFISLWQERGILHTVTLLVATFGLVLIENVSRIVLIAAGYGWKMDLSEGPDHFVLGLLLFAISIGLVLTTDQLLLFVLPRRSAAPVRSDAYARESTAGRRVLRTVSWAGAMILAVVFPVIGAAEIYRMPKRLPKLEAVWSGVFQLPKFGENALPPELAGFRRTGHTEIQRVQGDPLGHESQQWIYRSGGASALISLDYPYSGVHDLCVCYKAIGWTISNQRVIGVEELGDLPGGELGPIAYAELERPLYGRAVLMFSLADNRGQIDAVIKDVARGDPANRAQQRFAAVPADEAGAWQAVSSKAPYVQFQLLTRVNSPLDDRGRHTLTALYCQARQNLAAQVRASLNEQVPQDAD
ncbi:MAG: exosortase U [Planctomycetaceae bacterium]|nr:exosortase U [Planctomycetaceae bacterium]